MDKKKTNRLTASQANLSSEKMLTILEFLSYQNKPVRLQDISKQLSFPPSTTLRFMEMLKHHKYVAQEADTSRYFLTFKIFELANNLRINQEIDIVAKPFLQRIAYAFNEVCWLAMEYGMMMMYMEKAFPPNKPDPHLRYIGNLAPMHCTAVGKLLLLNYDQQRLDFFIEKRGLPRYTEYTITTPEELKAELELIRSRDYAIDNQECELGVRCVAAPVRNYTGNVLAAISISGSAEYMTDAHITANLPTLLKEAQLLSQQLGWLAEQP